MKKILFAIMIAATFASCNNQSNNEVQGGSENEPEIIDTIKAPTNQDVSQVSEQAETPIEKSNKQKMIDALRTATTEYSDAMSEDDLNRAEAKLKSETSAIQGNCTINELKDINKDEEYNNAWKECMQAFESSADRLGLL